MNNLVMFSLFKSDAQELINQGTPLLHGSGSGIAYDNRTGQLEHTGIYILRGSISSQVVSCSRLLSNNPFYPHPSLFMSGIKHPYRSGSLEFNSGSSNY